MKDDRHVGIVGSGMVGLAEALLDMSRCMDIVIDPLRGRKRSSDFSFLASSWCLFDDMQKPRGKYYKDYAMSPYVGYQKHPAPVKQKLKRVGKKPAFVLMDRHKRTRNRVWKPTI
jgi:hypothetical protein